MDTYLAGFALGLGLILAIGAQNAFVLRQGLRRSHVFAVCLTCALSDAILIAVGVAGFGALAHHVPWLETVMRIGGALFLLWYGVRALRSAWRGGAVMTLQDSAPEALGPVLLTVLALTWLNPHVYLDTVMLLGSIAAQYDARGIFAAGAITASFVFFFSFGYGARLLAPAFARSRTWQLLDLAIGLLMWGLAIKLIWL
ncbi:MAG: LysE/ArgO family amino acid transporter [Marinibacterium sp.]|nr:LysE/ArgO family amino acid transporter [Marinibacterium sp.]